MNFVWVAKGREHIEMAERSRKSVRKLYPDAGLFVYAPDVGMISPQVWEQPWMVANVMVQLEHLILHPSELTVFLDNDIVMMNRMETLPEADLWVTWRDNVGELSQTQPYNYGVLIASGNMASIRAMMWLEERVLKLSSVRQKWYGNQIALREMVGPLKRDATVHRNFGYFDLTIHQLPCHKWNWTPPDDRPKQSASDKIFVHLKGNRKELLDYYHQKAMA